VLRGANEKKARRVSDAPETNDSMATAKSWTSIVGKNRQSSSVFLGSLPHRDSELYTSYPQFFLNNI
jgi:hypothetical protein